MLTAAVPAAKVPPPPPPHQSSVEPQFPFSLPIPPAFDATDPVPVAVPEEPPDAVFTECALPAPPPFAVNPAPLKRKLDADPAAPPFDVLLSAPLAPAPTVTL